MEYQQLMHAQRYDGTTTLQKTAAHAIHNGEEYFMKGNSFLSSDRSLIMLSSFKSKIGNVFLPIHL